MAELLSLNYEAKLTLLARCRLFAGFAERSSFLRMQKLALHTQT